MQKRSLIIRGGLVLRPDLGAAEPADMLVADGQIVAIGAPGMAAPQEAETVDAAGFLLHPGLVNGHTHGHGQYSRGLAEDVTLEALLAGAPWFNGNRTHEDKYLSTAVGAAEMLLKGCTSCLDLFWEFPTVSPEGMHAAARAYLDCGMRAVVAPMVSDHPFLKSIPGLLEHFDAGVRSEIEKWISPPPDDILQRLRAVVDGWPFDPERIAVGLGPTVPLLCSDAFLKGSAALARDYGLPIQTHLSESRIQEHVAAERYGTSLTRHLHDLGFLSENMSAAHGVWLDDDDLAMLADAGATVVLNPMSNLRLGSGLPHMRRLLDKGVTVGIGTDSCGCSDNLNMYEAARIAGYLSHVYSHDYARWVSSAEVARAATEGSAAALGMNRIGTFAPGAFADIVFLDLSWIHWIPLRDALVQFVQAEDATAVRHVMVGGEWVVRDRRLLTLDLDKLRGDVAASIERLDRLNADNRELFRQMRPILGSYCAALAAKPSRVERMAGCIHAPKN